VTGLLDRLGVEYPVVQAGMGGGLAGAQLAAAVSEAGGLGQIGILAPRSLEQELETARRLTEKPVAVNLIVPFATRGHWRAAEAADAVVTHWDPRPRRSTSAAWIHTVGSAEEAQRAVEAGADAVIAQGIEAGGHVRGAIPAHELLDQVLKTVPRDYPVMLAGGIAGPEDVRAALDAGAVAALAGTRFLATEESGAHPGYKRRLIEGTETLLTELFGMGWPRAPHRVLPNAATRRWLDADGRPPRTVRALHGLASPAVRRIPVGLQMRLAGRASSSAADLSPPAPTAGMPEQTLETHPLYAGETVARIHELRPAAALVSELTP
jgi:NAD(P)H-dependent flavin oxidoreductase YrpB (nitropropane dioxygenase family)